METPALLFFPGSGPAAAFIRWWTKSRFAHVAPALFAEDGTAWAYDAYWFSGVTKRLLTPADMARVVRVNLPAGAFCEKSWLDAQVGKSYDKWSIVLIGLTKRSPQWLHVYVSRQGEWICSRLAAEAAGYEDLCWGLSGPPSPEDVFEMAAIRQ